MPVLMRATRALSRAMSAATPFESASSICCGMLADAVVRALPWERAACRVALGLHVPEVRCRVLVLAEDVVARAGRVAVYERFVATGRLAADVLRADACRALVAARLRGVGCCVPDGPLTGMFASLRIAMFHTTRIKAWRACVWRGTLFTARMEEAATGHNGERRLETPRGRGACGGVNGGTACQHSLRIACLARRA